MLRVRTAILSCVATMFAALAATTAPAANPVFTSKVITGKTPGHAVAIDADIEGAKDLYLVVTDAGNGYSCDWADWAEPTLVMQDGSKQSLTKQKWQSASTQWGQARVGKNASGGDLKIDGQPLSDGIGVHANSVVHFKLPAGVARFQARGGLDDGGVNQAGGDASSVQFIVYTQAPPVRVAKADNTAGGNLPPAEALSGLDVGEGLEVGLFAHEPLLLSPSNIDIDHRGRIWVCEIVNYRQFRNKDTAERKEGDRILILEDTDGDSKADKSTTFYQGRDIDSAHGVCVLGNKAIVSAGDSVFVLTDDDGDSKADRKDVLFTGIAGTQHDHGIHSFLFGPDGKLYFNFGNAGKQIKDKNGKPIVDKAGNVVNDSRKPYQEGMVFRCNMDGSEFETLGWNFRNNWEVAVDSFGTIWQSDNDDDGNRGVRINYVMEFGNYGYKDEFTGAGWKSPRTGMHEDIPQRHWHLNDPGVMPNLLQTGAGSPTGIMVYEGDLLPDRFRNQIIHCDAGPNIVRAYPAKVSGAGYTAEVDNILEGTRDKWFRPSDVCAAPDGSLIIADWYDPGVGGHRMEDIMKGRLFRIAPPNTPYTVPKFDFTTVDGAIKALMNPNNEVKYLAWTALHAMDEKAIPALQEVFKSHKDARMRARALWVLGKIHSGADSAVELALTDTDPNLRIVGIRLARQLEKDTAELLERMAADPNAAVRREVLIALRDKNAAALWTKLALQHDGKDRWYLEALGLAADGKWDAYFSAWAKAADLNAGDLTAAERDIIWRARSEQALPWLKVLITKPLNDRDRLRAFRALDFHPASAAKKQQLMALVAVDHAEQADIAALALKHLGKLNDAERKELTGVLNETVAKLDDPARVVDLVGQFKLTSHYPKLLEIARKQPDQQLGVEAMRFLLEDNQVALVTGSLDAEDVTQATAVLDAMGYSNHGRAAGVLQRVMNDKKRPLAVRRAAVTALSRIRKGAETLLAVAKSSDLDGKLKDAVASGLHGSQWRDIKEQAQKLFPLPPTKDNKPLPAIDVLVQKRGDAKRGRILYNTTATCVKCHIVNNVGRDVGPNLSEIGKKLSRQALYQSILYPSAGISHNYESYLLQLADGTTVNGLVTSRTDDEISLKNIESIVTTYKMDDVVAIKKQELSLMPADLQKVMTEQDLIDVVEYMTTLKEAMEFKKPSAKP